MKIVLPLPPPPAKDNNNNNNNNNNSSSRVMMMGCQANLSRMVTARRVSLPIWVSRHRERRGCQAKNNSTYNVSDWQCKSMFSQAV